MKNTPSHQKALHRTTNDVTQRASAGPDGVALVPPQNHTGLADELKAGVEGLSGLSLDDVRVHYNSQRVNLNTIQRMIDKDSKTQLNNLTQLNAALQRLTPQIGPLDLAALNTPGANLSMLETAIKNNNTNLYDAMTLADVVTSLAGDLAHIVDTRRPAFKYDPHGDKHFGKGKKGSKFTGNKEDVNQQLRALILTGIGRIRRDANGNDQTYYLTTDGIPECGDQDLIIQIDFTFASDQITYHGYPGTAKKHVLSRTLTGNAIPG